MKKPAILFPVETTARELLYKFVLSIKFAQKGYPVYLGTKEEIHRLFPILKSFVYFDKGYHQGFSEKIYEGIKKRNGIIISLDEEGGVDYDDFSTIAQRYSENLLQNVNQVFLWGDRQYEFLKLKRKNFNISRTKVTGHPRFELLKPEFHALYKNEVERLKKQYGNFLLFNTNMGFGNNIRGDDFVRRNYGSRIKKIDEIIEYDKIKTEAYISLIKRLASAIKKTIIFRPHPEENNSTYIEAFLGLTNVKVLFEGSVIPWIIASDLMIHPDCTTGIESAFIGKLPISYLPPSNKKVFTEIPLKISYCFSEENECLDYIIGGQYKNEIPSSSLLHDYFAHDNNSSDMIVNETITLLNQTINRSTAIVNTSNIFYVFSRSLKMFTLKVVKIKKNSDILILKKRSGFDIENIKKLISSIQNIIDFDKYITIHKIFNNLFHIKQLK